MHNAHNARIVTVSGSGSGCGKTLLVEQLLHAMADATAVKVQAHPDAPPSALEEKEPKANRQKDTGRYLAAGARRAYLLRGSAEELLETARKLAEDAGTGVVIFETNALATDLSPDLAFFVEGGPDKPGADRCRRAADVVVSPPTAQAEEGSRAGGKTDEDVRRGVREAARDGRIECKVALALAARLEVEPRLVGRACNQEGVKIAACQLGCFG